MSLFPSCIKIQTLNGVFKESLRNFQKNTAMRVKKSDVWEDITYADLNDKINITASFIIKQNIRRGDRIALILENRPEWGIIFFACVCQGIIVVPLDTHLTPNDIKNIINDSRAKAVFLSAEKNLLAEKLLEEPTPLAKIIVIDGRINTEKIAAFLKLDSPESRQAPAVSQEINISKDELAVILYTSGTTNSPKGVMLTHQNLYSNFNSLFRLNIISSRDRVLSILPLYHSYPLMVNLITPILGGACIVYPPSDWPDKLAVYVKETRTTILTAVPQIFSALHRRIENKMKETGFFLRLILAATASFSWFIRRHLGLNPAKIFLFKFHSIFGKQFRFFVSGGAKLDEKIETDFFKWGFTILEGYGLTETSPVVTFNPLNKPRIGSAGKAIPDVEIKIVNKDSQDIGEIAIKGLNVMKGYYKKEDETAKCLKEGYFFSGDLGYLNEEGYLYITGRSKELIVLSSGKNIYPQEVEEAYSATPVIKEICVVGVANDRDSKLQDYLYALVLPNFEYLKERGEMNIYEVIKNRLEDIAKGLPSHQHIMGFSIIKEPLPRTTLGKIKRYEVEQRYMSSIVRGKKAFERQEGFGGETSVLDSTVGQKVIKYLKETFKIKGEIYSDDSIEIDLGIDSLGRAELLSAMETAFAIKLPENMIAASIFTVKDLILKIEETLPKGAEERQPIADIGHLSIEELMKRPLGEEMLKSIELRPGIFNKIVTFLTKGFIYLIFKIFYKIEIKGATNIPRGGSYIICPNHTSFFDGFIIAALMPFHAATILFFIGFRRYFVAPIIRSLVKSARILPIDATDMVDAMQAAYFVLNNHKALCIFPEGERSLDGAIQRFKKGVGVIAKELNIKLIPALIEGAYEAWPRAKQFPRLSRIKVSFGPPLSAEELLKKGRGMGIKDDAEAIAAAVREKIIELKDKGYRT